MATITINIPDAALNRVLDAFAGSYGYDPASGTSKAVFAKAQLATHVKAVVASYEANQAAATAAATARASAEGINIT